MARGLRCPGRYKLGGQEVELTPESAELVLAGRKRGWRDRRYAWTSVSSF